MPRQAAPQQVDGIVHARLPDQDRAKPVEGGRVVRFGGQQRAKVLLGAVEPLLRGVGRAAAEQSLRLRRVEPQDRVETREGLLGPAVRQQQAPEIDAGADVIGRMAQSRAETCRGRRRLVPP